MAVEFGPDTRSVVFEVSLCLENGFANIDIFIFWGVGISDQFPCGDFPVAKLRVPGIPGFPSGWGVVACS